MHGARRWDLVLAGTAWANYADSVAYLKALPFLDAAERAELRRISPLRASRRERAAAALANTLARNGPPFAVFGTYAVPELFSATLHIGVHDRPSHLSDRRSQRAVS
jgi:hypothetical protein